MWCVNIPALANAGLRPCVIQLPELHRVNQLSAVAMDRFRSAHTPMDYEYSNGTGPVDESSPFITASRNASAQNKKRKLGAPPLSPQHHANT